MNVRYLRAGLKIAAGHWIFPSELIKSLISYVDKFSRMSESKTKKNTIKFIK